MTGIVEFAVQMKCDSCVNKIKGSLSNVEGIKEVTVSKENGTVLVESNLPSLAIKELIESTGRRAVLKGYGGKGDVIGDGSETRSAVAMLGGTSGFSVENIVGVVRFVQADDNLCLIDGTIDGLTPGYHGLHIHECGDLSRGCDSIGDHYDTNNSTHGAPTDPPSKRHIGDLGNILSDEEGRASFWLQDDQIKVWDIIGRSIAVTSGPDDLGKTDNCNSLIDGNSGNRLACGIISRSAGLFENSKKLCACDGVTLWDERDRPLAGPGRQSKM